MNETTNAVGQYIANLVVGKLCKDQITKPYLLCFKQLEVTNHAIISRFVNSALRILPTGGEERILLLVTDATQYMAGKKLKLFFENDTHYMYSAWSTQDYGGSTYSFSTSEQISII